VAPSHLAHEIGTFQLAGAHLEMAGALVCLPAELVSTFGYRFHGTATTVVSLSRHFISICFIPEIIASQDAWTK
jgi:hypothetical protein